MNLDYRYQIDHELGLGWQPLGNKVLNASWKIGKDVPNSITVLGMDTDAVIAVYADDLEGLSPYSNTGLYEPGKPIRIQCKLKTETSWTTMWKGRLYDMQFRQTPYLPPIWYVFAVGELQWLNSDQFHRHFVYRGDDYVKTGVLLLSILAQSGYTGTVRIGTGVADIAVGSLLLSDLTGNVYERVSSIDVLEALCRAELGMLYDTRDGTITFEDRNWRVDRKRANIDTDRWFIYGDGEGNKLSSIASVGSYTDSVYNIFGANVRQVFTGQLETVVIRYDGNRTLSMAPKTEVVEQVVLPQGNVDEVAYWSNPIAYINYSANSRSNGTGLDRTNHLQVTVGNQTSTSIDYHIRNNGSDPLWITYLDFQGAPFVVNQEYTLTRQDNDSILKYGERPFCWPSNLLRDAEKALPHVEWLLNAYKNPTPLIEMELPGNKYPEVVLDVEVSDCLLYTSPSPRDS